MNEIKPIEGVVLVLDPAVHVDAASRARVPVDGLSGVDDLQLLAVLDDADARARHDRHHGEGGPLGLPAARAAADVIMGALARDFHLDLIARTFADQRSAGKVRGCRLQTLIDGGMDRDCLCLAPAFPRVAGARLCHYRQVRSNSLNARTFATTSRAAHERLEERDELF